jgi:GT2 family glycosyltransferase
MISIIIPSFNNLEYLSLCVESLQKNSHYKNEILIHINEGSDGTIEFIKQKKLKFTHSRINDGLCIGCNKISKLSSFQYILYAHDDMYFLPKWDLYLIEEAKSLKTNKFYLSSIMINGDPKLNGHLNLNAGDTAENFNEKYLLQNYENLKHDDFQGSTWAPHLIHKDLWDEVGGFSEEFSPGMGSDPDLNMKLWKAGVRIFKCLSKSRVYHFGSITVHKNQKSFLKKKQGSTANKIFLLKWGFTIKFFKKHYLKSHFLHNQNLNEPSKNLIYYIDLIKDKFLYYYYKIFSSVKL